MTLIAHRFVTALGSLYAAAMAVLAWTVLPRHLSPPTAAYFIGLLLAAIAVVTFPWGWVSGADVPRLEEEAVPQTTRDRARVLLGMSSLGGPAVLAAAAVALLLRGGPHLDPFGLGLAVASVAWAYGVFAALQRARGGGSPPPPPGPTG